MSIYTLWVNLVFWIALIAAIIIYTDKKKWHPVMYIISAGIYLSAVGFVIYAFELKQNGILLTLAISAILMILAGWYLSKTSSSKR